MSERFLTEAEKAREITTFAQYRADSTAWRREHPEAKGGEGYIDHEVLPLTDDLNEIEGVCTIQSCCGHVNKGGYAYPGQLWIRLSEMMSQRFDTRVGDLLARDVIHHITKLYSFQGGRLVHEVIDIRFHGSSGSTSDPSTTGSAGDRMEQARRTLVAFFAALASPPQERESCTNCDGKGYLTAWPHTTCSTCNGTGSLPPERESFDNDERTSSRAPIRTEGDDLVKPPFGDDLEATPLPLESPRQSDAELWEGSTTGAIPPPEPPGGE